MVEIKRPGVPTGAPENTPFAPDAASDAPDVLDRMQNRRVN